MRECSQLARHLRGQVKVGSFQSRTQGWTTIAGWASWTKHGPLPGWTRETSNLNKAPPSLSSFCHGPINPLALLIHLLGSPPTLGPSLNEAYFCFAYTHECSHLGRQGTQNHCLRLTFGGSRVSGTVVSQLGTPGPRRGPLSSKVHDSKKQPFHGPFQHEVHSVGYVMAQDQNRRVVV